MAFLIGWGSRKSKIINGSTAGAQTNFQMMITVHKASGTDTPTDIYLGSNVRDDFGDVRFTSSNGTTLLDYWIETYTSGVSARIWVEVPTIPASPNTTYIYIYYNNPSATDIGNGENTFLVFSTGTDFANWTGDSSNVGGELHLLSYAFSCNRKTFSSPISRPFTLEARIKEVTSAAPSFHIVTDDGTGTSWGANRNFQLFHDPIAGYNAWHYNQSAIYTLYAGYSINTYYIHKESTIGANNYNLEILDTNRISLGSITGIAYSGIGAEFDPTPSVQVGSGNHPSLIKDIYVTWLFIRKTASPEPTFGGSIPESESTPSLGNIFSSIQRGISFTAGIGASLGRQRLRNR